MTLDTEEQIVLWNKHEHTDKVLLKQISISREQSKAIQDKLNKVACQ